MMEDAEPSLTAGRVDQLERHLAIEPGVPGAVHLAEGAAADPLERAQVAPVRQRVSRDRRSAAARLRRERKSDDARSASAATGPELREHGPAGVVRARLGAHPVDRRAIEHRAREIGNEVVHSWPRFISSASRTSARSAALRAASGAASPGPRPGLRSVSHLDTGNDGLPLLWPQPGQRVFIAVHRFAADRLLDWRRRAIDLQPVQFARLRLSSFAAELVANPVEDRLS